MVPHNPRLPAERSLLANAQSSSTMTIATLIPSPAAISNAFPKFNRSPS